MKVEIGEEEIRGDIESDYLRFVCRRWYWEYLKEGGEGGKDFVEYLVAVGFRVGVCGVGGGWGGRGITEDGRFVDGFTGSVLG